MFLLDGSNLVYGKFAISTVREETIPVHHLAEVLNAAVTGGASMHHHTAERWYAVGVNEIWCAIPHNLVNLPILLVCGGSTCYCCSSVRRETQAMPTLRCFGLCIVCIIVFIAIRAYRRTHGCFTNFICLPIRKRERTTFDNAVHASERLRIYEGIGGRAAWDPFIVEQAFWASRVGPAYGAYYRRKALACTLLLVRKTHATNAMHSAFLCASPTQCACQEITPKVRTRLPMCRLSGVGTLMCSHGFM